MSIEDLDVNDTLKLKDNSIVVIDNKIIFPIFVEVYNLEIEDNENYYVTEERIRVHNGNVDQLKKIEERDFKDVKATRNTPVRDKFIIQIVLTALIFLHIPAVPLAYSHKSRRNGHLVGW